ncbi:MAG TPA: nodulation protein NfeD, partial [Phnomibacter sp.]|nr:nodulation protein NfeD [Phnomibacter sp.]
AAQKVVTINIDGAINPVVADHISAGIKKATAEQAECLIINLNTPGGLLKSTRVIVSDMLEAKVPIVVYVSPSGAHAGSAGVFITMAAHIAAMAPGTNIGSAHPVNLQGGMDSIMGEKTTNDAAAFIRSIAEKRGRNMEWAEEAVRLSVALAETEALKKNVVNLIAENEEDLLKQLHGWTVYLEKEERVLATEGATSIPLSMTWVQKVLNYISDPNIAYILMLLGLYGLIFEFYNPGIGFPGVVGGISLILAFYAMHTLPINIAGLALIALAIILFILELSTPTNGILSIGAVVSLLLGSMMLIKPGIQFEWAKISLGVIIPSVIISALFFLTIVGIGLRAQRAKVVTGVEGLVGDTGKAVTDIDPTGSVLVQGELWSAKNTGTAIAKGEEVKVREVHGLLLTVEPISLSSST